MQYLTNADLLRAIVVAWDAYRLGDVAQLVTIARSRFGLTLPAKNRDRINEADRSSPVRPSAEDPTGDQEREALRLKLGEPLP